MDKYQFKKMYLDEINKEAFPRREALKHLDNHLKWLHSGWDSIVEKDGNYYFYDYERKHRNKEEYGDKLSVEQVSKYFALTDLINDFNNDVIKTTVPLWSY